MRASRARLPRGGVLTAALAFLGAFALGSVPVAWLLVRLVSRRDLARSGSANIGALNALRVSRSRLLGVAVLVLDLCKGACAVLLARALGADPGWGLVGVVAGHDYNPWLSLAAGRLVGGKGFASAGGALLLTMPWLVAVWLGVGLLAWLAFRVARGIGDEAPASAVATLALVPAGGWLHGGRGALALGAVALLVLPKLAREVRALLARPR